MSGFRRFAINMRFEINMFWETHALNQLAMAPPVVQGVGLKRLGTFPLTDYSSATIRICVNFTFADYASVYSITNKRLQQLNVWICGSGS